MHEPERYYDREAEICEELRAITNGESAEKTFIRGKAFNHRKWLNAERSAVTEKATHMEESITISGEFAGLKR